MTDAAPLIALRTMVRRAYHEAAALEQTPEVRETRTRLDEICTELTVEIEIERAGLRLPLHAEERK